MQQKTNVINVCDHLPSAEMYEIWSQVVTEDLFITPGVNGYASRLITCNSITQDAPLMPGKRENSV